MSLTLVAVALGLAAIVAAVFLLARRSQRSLAAADDERSDAVDAWLHSALAAELAQGVTALSGERERIQKALGGDPDPTIVSAIEDAVRGVELEYLRYPHEEHVDVIAHVRYEGGKSADVRGRVARADVPAGVRRDLDDKATMRLFRPWAFPWQAQG